MTTNTNETTAATTTETVEATATKTSVRNGSDLVLIEIHKGGSKGYGKALRALAANNAVPVGSMYLISLADIDGLREDLIGNPAYIASETSLASKEIVATFKAGLTEVAEAETARKEKLNASTRAYRARKAALKAAAKAEAKAEAHAELGLTAEQIEGLAKLNL